MLLIVEKKISGPVTSENRPVRVRENCVNY
jgi:hypothetical protein